MIVVMQPTGDRCRTARCEDRLVAWRERLVRSAAQCATARVLAIRCAAHPMRGTHVRAAGLR